MDALTHSLVGLTAAKAGFERLSPYTTAVCILSANAPDSDIVWLLAGDRWTFLQHHRGITHSVVGTLVLGVLIPSIFFATELVIARWRNRPPRIRYRGLLLASVITAATHPLMDWTNNYGVRPLLPWDGRWFYGDLVFVVDPYLWLMLGGTAFLLTSNRRSKIVAWSTLAIALTVLVLMASAPRSAGAANLKIVRTIWIVGVILIVFARSVRLERRFGKSIALAALAFVVLYWGTLALAHGVAYGNALSLANQLASQQGERFVRAAAMPTVANPTLWLCVAETDRAMYRFFVGVGLSKLRRDSLNVVSDGNRSSSFTVLERYEKPSGRAEELAYLAARDRRAQILLGFARFPIARIESDNCFGQTLVQFADLRYTEPGASRGSFSLTVPVECPAR